MKLHQFTTHGIGIPYRDETVSIDFDAVADGLVAILGTNGAGKSTLLDLTAPGALFRELPHDRDPKGKRGASLVDFVHPDTRDAFVDETFTIGGHTYRVRVAVDGKRRKTEAFVWQDGAEEPIAGPLASDVDEALARIVPSRAMFLAGPFACQGGFDGFFRLGPTERKALFIEMLGLGQLEALAVAAGEREKAALGELETVRRELDAVAGRAERAAAIGTALAELAPALASGAGDVEAARTAESAARVTLDDARATLTRLEAEAQAATRERERLAGERDKAAGRVAVLTEKLQAIDATLADAAVVEAQAAALSAIDGELATARQQEQATLEALRPLETTLATERAAYEGMKTDHRRLTSERITAEAAAAQLAVADRLGAGLDAGRAALAAVGIELEDAENARPSLVVRAEEEQQAAVTRTRLEARQRELQPQTGLLDRIPGAPECGACPLTAHARDARGALAQVETELADLPPASKAAAEALAAHDVTLTALRGQQMRGREWLSLHERLATVDPAVRAQAERAPTLATEIADLVTTGTAKRESIESTEAAVRAHTATLDVVRTTLGDLEACRATVAAAASRLPAITAARAERAGVAEQLAEADVALAEIAATPLPPTVDLAAPQAAVTAATATLDDATRRLATAATAHQATLDQQTRLEGERAGLGDVEATAAALREREGALVTGASDWAVLRKALGRNGVQALLIDAAGPEVSTIANDLLATCYTPRFQIALTTTQPTADGKGVKEVFEPRLLDAEAGREGTRGSGGEMALIDAALRLAVVLTNTRRSGMEMRTLWLDEATAALAAENAPKYVDMIRRAAQLGGFHQVLLVTHDPNIWEGADARLIVEDGQVRVWQPAAAEAA